MFITFDIILQIESLNVQIAKCEKSCIYQLQFSYRKLLLFRCHKHYQISVDYTKITASVCWLQFS